MIVDVNTDQQDSGLQGYVKVDRSTAARFGISSQLVDNVLYDAFGEREVSTIYTALNQYYVVMVVGREFWQNPLVPAPSLRLCAERAGGSLKRVLAF